LWKVLDGLDQTEPTDTADCSWPRLVPLAMTLAGSEQARFLGFLGFDITQRLAREKIDPASRVRSPRHLIVYRVAADGVVEVLALVHDRMVLSRAAHRSIRAADRD
jgi:hypothetical protein